MMNDIALKGEFYDSDRLWKLLCKVKHFTGFSIYTLSLWKIKEQNFQIASIKITADNQDLFDDFEKCSVDF